MPEAPRFHQLMWPTLKALSELGGSGSNQEILDKIIELEGYGEDIQSIPHTDGRTTRLAYNCAWARTYLKKYGAINSSGRAVWVLLDKGENLTEDIVREIPATVRQMYANNVSNDDDENIEPDSIIDEHIDNNLSWKQNLLNILYQIDPSDFERLCQLILRKSGFTKVEVTGKTGDGGIDGMGILRVNLLSFHVSFQCKRYQNSVGSAQIRDFRGAFVGRGDKGLFMTTGTFTSEARKEASRDGAPAIDLIDGDDLCDLLKELSLGVDTELVEKVTINDAWFENF